ncbi:MAG: PQQ-dependent sugar dehydrogenase [Pseudomonadota bacterium]
MKITSVCAAIAASFLAAACSAQPSDLSHVRLPDGFAIEVYAEVPAARAMVEGADGTVFVSTRRDDVVYAVLDNNAGEGGSREVLVLDDGLDMPNGIAYKDGDLYVAELSRVLKYSSVDDQLRDMPEPEVLDIELNDERHHGWREIAFGPDGLLYISLGAPCNVCDRDGFSKIVRMQPDGSEREDYALGVRNSVGFTWDPATDHLWFTDNGRDMLGDDLPPDELNYAPVKDGHYGFPFCHGGFFLDPQFGDGKNCDDYVAPAEKLGAHVASLGLDFYDGTEFPEAYQGRIFIAEHGSWNRTEKSGYRITTVTVENGQSVAYDVFADGFNEGNTVFGRPVDILVRADGSMLVSDDQAGLLYRVTYEGSR